MIEAYGCFFHITSDERWDRIRVEGFSPAAALAINGDMYKNTPFAGRGFLNYTIPSHLGHVVRMVGDGMGSIRDKVILQVPAAVIAAGTFDLDRTKQENRCEVGDNGVPSPEQFRGVIERHGYIACFDPIPPDRIRFVCRAEEFQAEPLSWPTDLNKNENL